MEIKIEAQKVMELYKQRVAELEHELIIMTAKCAELTEMLNEMNKTEK